MKIDRYILLVLIGMSVFQLSSQDIHFSQFNGSLLNITPGYTGMYDGDYRIGAIYRSQWQSVPVNYQTFSMSGEKVFRPKEMEKDKLGVGILFNSDRAGDARYGTTQAYMTGSYIYSNAKDTSLNISFGISMGWCQVGFDYTKMTFDNQYDGLAYNSGISNNEKFNWVSRNFFDMNGGLVIQKSFKQKHHLSFALGVYHINAPKISYVGDDLSRLDYKFSNCISYNTPIRKNTDIIVETLLSKQGKNYEVIPHVSLKYYLEKRENKAILGGLCYRARDAVILRMGYTNQTLQSGISYDINISNFTPATNHRGGI